ncbi:rasGAP-activating 1 [Labeo rohita]|uniref:RasGAP-activating 1 n=1 Tax=Labeo rohita TaxID=84645 RepID=A0A498N754_LABRO|nr:rasGAP-activating 1 [Labeo rohita]
MGDWSDPLDPDAETQIIYKELLQGRDKLRKQYLETQEMQAAKQEEPLRASQPSSVSAQGRSERARVVAARLLDVVLDLERAHSTFQSQEPDESRPLILSS